MQEDTTQSKRKKLIEGLNPTNLENALPRRSKGDMRTTIALPAQAWSRLEWFAREFSISQKRTLENAVKLADEVLSDSVFEWLDSPTSSTNKSCHKIRKTVVLAMNCFDTVENILERLKKQQDRRQLSRDDVFEQAIKILLIGEVVQAKKRISIYVPWLGQLEEASCKIGEVPATAQKLPRDDPGWRIINRVQNQLNEACDHLRELINDAKSYAEEDSTGLSGKEE